MNTQKRKTNTTNSLKGKRIFTFNMRTLLMTFAFLLTSVSGFAHCDSYDGPVINEALKALDQNNVELVLKWIEPQQEKEIISLFDKTYRLKKGDQEVYAIVEKHFLETLVRLHRETEGADFTGLKPAGSMTPWVEMADNSIAQDDVEKVITTVNHHFEEILRERYAKVAELYKTRDKSVEQGREYVHAYVQYTHTLEHLEELLNHPIAH